MDKLPLPTINNSLLEMIGNTPLLEIKNIDVGVCRLFVKMESQNPGGSIKDRVAVSIIEQAEKDGLLKPGGTIVEATAGNTGIGLALIFGYVSINSSKLTVRIDCSSKSKSINFEASDHINSLLLILQLAESIPQSLIPLNYHEL